MDDLISKQQSTFIPGRQIQVNIIIAHEVFNSLKHKRTGSKASMAIQMGLNKAFNRIFETSRLKLWRNWALTEKDRLGFSICLHSEILVTTNGGQVYHVSPRRGLRQGDPFSPYLFLLVADVFSTVVTKAIRSKSLGAI